MSFLPIISDLISPLRRLLGPAPPPPPTGPFTPTYKDVCHARALLRTLDLPTELVLQILDYAQYWPVYEYSSHIPREASAETRHFRPCVATVCYEAAIFDNVIYDDIRKSGERCQVKSVEFEVVSRDQGWTSQNTQGTFETTSWTEVSIMRDTTGKPHRSCNFTLEGIYDSPASLHARLADQERDWELVKRPESASMGPQDGEGHFAWYLQGNCVAAGNREYHVSWTGDGFQGNEGSGTGEGFVRELKDGDRILIWARAKYPGWQCHVDYIKIVVRYGF
ncbi:hypothetical protein IAQ61_010315 [Plenodomus lingam]|uniref:Uncharacterized protein n=1 Tax=Leptosphaeria maculans (strain JN3 / isolate v23.1.3 / race Av1-4-5-6-7-8) TaxID=985895 RepID=E5A3K5_LEPMJ|nr:hypothetical protein LEMA_P096270.1 [Plenodomus lingam JN3]KAH9862112.1 hypothetical protein IAQ61_010315 [Plenodomus lingam]CBX98218.1 hypothetical protein LEMA_P096270.1 [Plenodomus lingam JN3]